MIDCVMLEIEGTREVLRIDLTEEELTMLLGKKAKKGDTRSTR